jgi:hypothetical protein
MVFLWDSVESDVRWGLISQKLFINPLYKAIATPNIHKSREMVEWCSWLSRQSNNVSSLKVSSSSLGSIKWFFFRCETAVERFLWR